MSQTIYDIITTLQQIDSGARIDRATARELQRQLRDVIDWAVVDY